MKSSFAFFFFLKKKSFSFKMASYLDLSPGLFFLVWSDGKNVDVVIGRIVVKRARKTKARRGGETGSNLRNSQLPFAMPPNPALFLVLPGDTMIVERTQHRLSSQQNGAQLVRRAYHKVKRDTLLFLLLHDKADLQAA